MPDDESLNEDELAEEEAELLPDREEMSFVDLGDMGGMSPPAPIMPDER
jgi:hypothetical protein